MGLCLQRWGLYVSYFSEHSGWKFSHWPGLFGTQNTKSAWCSPLNHTESYNFQGLKLAVSSERKIMVFAIVSTWKQAVISSLSLVQVHNEQKALSACIADVLPLSFQAATHVVTSVQKSCFEIFSMVGGISPCIPLLGFGVQKDSVRTACVHVLDYKTLYSCHPLPFSSWDPKFLKEKSMNGRTACEQHCTKIDRGLFPKYFFLYLYKPSR